MIAQDGCAEIAHVLAAVLEALAALDQLRKRERYGLKVLLQFRQAPAVAHNGDGTAPPFQTLAK